MEIAVRFTRGGKTNLIFSLTLNKLMKINYFMSDNPKKCALKLKKTQIIVSPKISVKKHKK